MNSLRGARNRGLLRGSDANTDEGIRPRMTVAKAQARFVAELACIKTEHGRWLVMEQPSEPTMCRARAMRRATTDARTIVVSVGRAEDGERVRFATNAPHSMVQIRECSWAEDASEALCNGLQGQLKGDMGVHYMCHCEYYDETETCRKNLDGAEVDRADARTLHTSDGRMSTRRCLTTRPCRP